MVAAVIQFSRSRSRRSVIIRANARTWAWMAASSGQQSRIAVEMGPATGGDERRSILAANMLSAADPLRQPQPTCVGLVAKEWTPREMRHSFVSLLSDDGMPIEQIARLVGRTSTAVTETVYRQQIRPVMIEGAEAMDRIFPTLGAGDEDRR